jgi:dihydrofolate reductase
MSISPFPAPPIAIIAAMTPSRVIGVRNTLPWHVPEDLKRFKALTLGHTIVMGRKTYESIGRALPGRRNVVVSRSPHTIASVETVNTLDRAFSSEFATDAKPTFMIGGGELYTQTLAAFAERVVDLHFTIVQSSVEGDAHFPELDWARWHCVSRESHTSAGAGALAFAWEHWTRAAP